MLRDVNNVAPQSIRTSLTLTRRRLLRFGFSSGVLSLGLAASPLWAGPSVPHLDFGPRYQVQNVYRRGQGTHVELKFRVNGRAFTTHLFSADERIWRPV